MVKRKTTFIWIVTFKFFINVNCYTLVCLFSFIQKCWTLTAWTDDDTMLAEAYEAVDVIDWKADAAVMHYKHQAPHPAVIDFLTSKHGAENDNKDCYPGDQFVFPIKNALSLQIRY